MANSLVSKYLSIRKLLVSSARTPDGIKRAAENALINAAIDAIDSELETVNAALDDASIGWSPVLGVVIDGSRRVLQVTDWTGGTGSEPASGLYVGAAGLTAVIADGIDIRGATGATGAAGAAGATGPEGPAGSITSAIARSTIGNISFANTSWADLSTAMDLTLAAEAGDVIELTLNGATSNENNTINFDAVTRVGGSAVNSVGTAGTPPTTTGQGVAGWTCTGSSGFAQITGSIPYVVQAGDISGGTVTFRPRARTNNASPNRTVQRNADSPLVFFAKNLGQ